jgi:hypothetical protein
VSDLVQLHSCEPLDIERFVALFSARFSMDDLQRDAELVLAVTGPWRPAELWPLAPERCLWTLTLLEGRECFTGSGTARAGRVGGMERRQAVVTPLEAVADGLSGGLILVHSDAGRSAYAAVWRERHLRHSLRLDDGRVCVRCDGQAVIVESPPKHLPEGDRTGVLLDGLSRLVGERVEVEPADRFVVPDVLAELGAQGAAARLRRAELVVGTRDRMVAGK